MPDDGYKEDLLGAIEASRNRIKILRVGLNEAYKTFHDSKCMFCDLTKEHDMSCEDCPIHDECMGDGAASTNTLSNNITSVRATLGCMNMRLDELEDEMKEETNGTRTEG